LRSLIYGTLGPAPKKISQELNFFRVAKYMLHPSNIQLKPENDKEYFMLGAIFNSFDFHTIEINVLWKIVPLSSLLNGWKFVGNRWVFTAKDDGTYRSITIPHRISQVTGKDIIDSHAPVMTYLAF
jgi:hypothetical protein